MPSICLVFFGGWHNIYPSFGHYPSPLLLISPSFTTSRLIFRVDARAYEKSEDPIYVLDHNLPIDTKYYLDNQLSKPLLRIFEPVLGDKAESVLLAGGHTRTIHVAAPKMGGLMKFAIKTATCLGCKTALKKDGTCTFFIRKKVR